VPLTLVTGPANAEKARVVLDGYRAALKRGEAPILVVPTFADVERYRMELAGGGVVFGTQVVRFGWLIDEAARRAGVRGRPLVGLARERVAAAAVATTKLSALAPSAATAGFTGALLGLIDELEQRRVTPQRLTQALRAWADDDERRRAYADEVSALYSAYRRTLERLRRSDRPLYAAAALDALREQPAAWGGTPVFVYGFDDLTAIEVDAVQTLAQIGARITLSLAFEPGRLAFSGRATTFAQLHGPDVEHVVLKPREEHYAPAARRALHQLERGLFELGEGTLFDPDPVDPGDAVTLLQGGGERAELELVAAEALRLIRDEHVPAEEIAVVARNPAAVAALVAEVFESFGVPVAVERRVAEVLDTLPALEVCHRPSPSSSRSSHSFASRQSRLTVSDETWSTSAVSSTLKPPKNRNSIIRLFRSSIFANASKARSRATTSTVGSGDVTSSSCSVTRCASPPRLRYPRRRA